MNYEVFDYSILPLFFCLNESSVDNLNHWERKLYLGLEVLVASNWVHILSSETELPGNLWDPRWEWMELMT